jgi:hypothetical protein
MHITIHIVQQQLIPQSISPYFIERFCEINKTTIHFFLLLFKYVTLALYHLLISENFVLRLINFIRFNICSKFCIFFIVLPISFFLFNFGEKWHSLLPGFHLILKVYFRFSALCCLLILLTDFVCFHNYEFWLPFVRLFGVR